MKALHTQTLLLSLACAGLVACGANGAGGSVQTDITQPSSPMQSSLSSANDSLTASTAEDGSTAAPDGQSKLASCVAVVTNPSPLDPNNLPQQFSISWTYTNCMRSLRGGTFNGTRMVEVTLDANDSNRTAVQTFNVQADFVNGADLAAQGNSTVVRTGTIASGSVMRVVTGDGNRVFTAANGNERFNHTYTHTLTVQDTFANNALSQRVINGTGTLEHNLIDATSVTTFTNITYDPATCAWPVAGTLEVKTTYNKSGKVDDEIYTYNSTCGSVLVNSGTTVTLPDAP